MVLQKTQIRSRIEAENAQREKKIAQLNEFIARFSAGTRASQVTSRKKEVERLQTPGTGALEHPAAVHPLRAEAAVGQASRWNSRTSSKALRRRCTVINGFTRVGAARRENRADGPQRRGQDHAAEGAAGECAGR